MKRILLILLFTIPVYLTSQMEGLTIFQYIFFTFTGIILILMFYIMIDYLNEWLNTYDSNVERLQHFLTADASLLSTTKQTKQKYRPSQGNNPARHVHVDVLERIQPRSTTDVSTDVSTSNVNSIDTTMEKETSMAMDVNEIIHVTHAEVVTQRWDPHVQYVIRTRSSHNNSVLFVTRRRARFFTVLHGQLKKMGYKNLPLLPGTRGINLTKIMSGKTFDCGAVQEKRLAVFIYLRHPSNSESKTAHFQPN